MFIHNEIVAKECKWSNYIALAFKKNYNNVMDQKIALQVKNLSKTYRKGTLKAVDDVSFKVYQNEIFGILGPNGAGKTTTLEMIEGLRTIENGSVTLADIQVKHNNRKKLQNKIGVQLQSSSYFERLKLLEILNLFGSFYEQSLDPIELLSMVELESKKNELVKNLSGGQAQRFSIVAALVNDPQVVFLDEPTTGLDPNIRRKLWDVIRKINQQGKTIILTTHYMEEAEELCDRVAIMESGKIAACDSPQNLITQNELKFTIKFATHDPLTQDQKNDLSEHNLVLKFWDEKEKHVFRIEDPTKVNDILNWLEKKQIQFRNLEIIPPNLEDVFIFLTGKTLRP